MPQYRLNACWVLASVMSLNNAVFDRSTATIRAV